LRKFLAARAVNNPMTDLATDRRGTAAIEFALVAPIMVVLVLGLADGVRRNLAMIDLDAAAHAGARTAALRGPGAARRAISTMLRAPGAAAEILIIDCTRPSGRAAGCTALPAGRYAAVTTSRNLPSLFDPARDPVLQVTALIRLP
jgi:Flp pilus assembly protein TadG